MYEHNEDMSIYRRGNKNLFIYKFHEQYHMSRFVLLSFFGSGGCDYVYLSIVSAETIGRR